MLRSINKHKALPGAQSEPSFEIEPRADQDNDNNFNLEIDVDVKRDFSYGHSDLMDPTESIASRAESEASTVQMMVVPLSSFDEHDSVAPVADTMSSKALSPPHHPSADFLKSALSNGHNSTHKEQQPIGNEDDYDFPAMNDKFPTCSSNSNDFNDTHGANHDDIGHTPASDSSASPYLDTPANISPRMESVDPLESWEKRIEASLSHDRQREETGMEIDLEDSPRLQSASNSPKRSSASLDTEALPSHAQSVHHAEILTSEIVVDAGKDQNENNDDDDQSSEYSFEYVNDSRLSTTDDGDHLQQHRALHLSRDAADTSATNLAIEGTFLRSASPDFTLSSHQQKAPSSSAAGGTSSQDRKPNDVGAPSLQPVYFDLDRFNEMVDASLGEKPVPKKKVSFRENIITDIYYRDRVTKEEQPLMFYSHEEENQFNEDQYEEAMKAENLGMSWQDWVQEHLHDPVETDASRSQQSAGIAASPSHTYNHHNSHNNNNRSSFDYYTSEEDEFEVGEDTVEDFGDDDAF